MSILHESLRHQHPGPHVWLAALRAAARERERAGLRRALRPRGPADATIDLAGNDYLGLSRHPAVIAAATAAIGEYGLGATASRLVRGTTDVHAALEEELAAWLGTESALVYSSGYLANVGALRALAGQGATVISDAHNHASLVDGCRDARARVIVTRHADPAAVAAALDAAALDVVGHAVAGGRIEESTGPALVVTESVFSVDGDLAPLGELHALTRAAGALLLVDDAHGVGLLGPRGAGGVAAAGLAGEPDVIVTATLSKALGGAGGVIAGPRALIDTLIDTGRTFIYDTGLPPGVAAGVRAALALCRDGDDLRMEVADRAARLGGALAGAGHRVWPPAAGVLSVAAPSPETALGWAEACRARGVAVGCFRPPSTPDGSSRLRLTVNAGVPRADFDRAIDVILTTAP